MTSTLSAQIDKELISRLKLKIRAGLVETCMDMPPADRPFNPFSPGNDPRFSPMVQEIVDLTLASMAEHIEDTFVA